MKENISYSESAMCSGVTVQPRAYTREIKARLNVGATGGRPLYVAQKGSILGYANKWL